MRQGSPGASLTTTTTTTTRVLTAQSRTETLRVAVKGRAVSPPSTATARLRRQCTGCHTASRRRCAPRGPHPHGRAFATATG
eukprot:scaffold1516_cov266-Prasinococcus_capsulatus_cf.AAC.3